MAPTVIDMSEITNSASASNQDDVFIGFPSTEVQ
jgi:hypothetical protein